jgi:hypothetical protein
VPPVTGFVVGVVGAGAMIGFVSGTLAFKTASLPVGVLPGLTGELGPDSCGVVPSGEMLCSGNGADTGVVVPGCPASGATTVVGLDV